VSLETCELTGGCHCGAVRFSLRAPTNTTLLACNCSICEKLAYLHLIVNQDDFVITKGEAELTEYQFGSKAALHLFCKHCGIKSFYQPRSHPNGVSVNARCVDQWPLDFAATAFDGKNWERNIDQLLSV
jgi:hypothetical protein